MGKNFVFISPTFPKNYYQFPLAWKRLGGNALCIGEDSWDSLSAEMKSACTDYYQVGSMENYDEMYRAVAWFAHEYGKIDWLESNNEYWLEQDAALRTDFNIVTGDKSDAVMRFKTKANMKAYYEKAGVPVARYHLTTSLEEGRKFVKKVGYPVIVKPNDGVGASATWKITSDAELKHFYHRDLPCQYIMEEFVPGNIVSFDGIVDQNNNIIFKTSHTFPDPIMDIVNGKNECWYYSEREIPKDLDEIGSKVIHAFDVRGRFFHTEYFRLYEDKPGLGKKGDIVGLEVNMRPPGGYTPDMMDFANDINVYEIYAEMAMYNEESYSHERPYYCVYVGRRDGQHYANDDSIIYENYGNDIVMHGRMPELLSDAMGNEFYIARFTEKDEMMDFVHYVYKKQSEVEKTDED